MITSVKPEDSPEENGFHRWTYTDVTAGSSHRGWIAGKVFGAYLHFLLKRSEPCRARMTGHALGCPHCESKIKAVWRGYVPYYDEEYTRRFVLVAPEYLESVNEIGHLEPIVITRGKAKTDPVVIKPKVWRISAPTIPHNEQRAEPVDLARFCVRVLWKDDVLCAWDNEQRRKAAVDKPATPKQSKSGDMLQGARKRASVARNPEDWSTPLADLLPGLANYGKPSENGKHTKTDEKEE